MMSSHVPDTPENTQSGAWLVEQWTAALSQAVASMMGSSPQVGLDPSPPGSAPQEPVFWWEQPFSASPDCSVWIGAPETTWKEIGREVLKSAGIDEADDENIRSTYLEILSQSLSGLSQALSARLRREVTSAGGVETAPAGAPTVALQIVLGEARLPILVAYSAALAALCESSAGASPQPRQTPAGREQEQKGAPALESRGYPKGLDLLLDVELPVSVSFGHAELPIRDVLKLATGSIVELNRSISEPVEIIVNNVVIARGEVVIVEGNFGVRIKQVISRQERLRTLR